MVWSYLILHALLHGFSSRSPRCHQRCLSDSPHHQAICSDRIKELQVKTVQCPFVITGDETIQLMMTSSNGNIFHVTGLVWEEFSGHRWISLCKGQWRGALMVSLICALTNGEQIALIMTSPNVAHICLVLSWFEINSSISDYVCYTIGDEITYPLPILNCAIIDI